MLYFFANFLALKYAVRLFCFGLMYVVGNAENIQKIYSVDTANQTEPVNEVQSKIYKYYIKLENLVNGRYKRKACFKIQHPWQLMYLNTSTNQITIGLY